MDIFNLIKCIQTQSSLLYILTIVSFFFPKSLLALDLMDRGMIGGPNRRASRLSNVVYIAQYSFTLYILTVDPFFYTSPFRPEI